MALSLSFFIIACNTSAKLFPVDKSKTGVRYKGARGTIFNDQYPFSMLLLYSLNLDSTKRWTPEKDDIELAERILKTHIKKIKTLLSQRLWTES